MSYDFSKDALEYGLKGFKDFDFLDGGIGKNDFDASRDVEPINPQVRFYIKAKYELALDLLMNTFNTRDVLAIKQEMEKFHENEVTLFVLKKAGVVEKCTDYILEHTEKSMDDLMEAIELLVERLN